MSTNSRELLAWAASVISREVSDKTTGKVVLNLHEGVIQSAKVERTERPAKKR